VIPENRALEHGCDEPGQLTWSLVGIEEPTEPRGASSETGPRGWFLLKKEASQNSMLGGSVGLCELVNRSLNMDKKFLTIPRCIFLLVVLFSATISAQAEFIPQADLLVRIPETPEPQSRGGQARLEVAAQTDRISSTPSFLDVPRSHWAFEYIEALFEAGYVSGCSSEPAQYCPDEMMTRAEMAVFIERGIHGADFMAPSPADQIFSDVALAEWYAKWATGLWNDEFTDGCGIEPLVFCPLQVHTRAESAVYFERLLNGKDFIPPTPFDAHFVDVGVGSDEAWYSKWVYAAFEDNLIQDCEDDANRSDNRFRPEDGLTRAEAACIMAKAKGLPVVPQGKTVVVSTLEDATSLNPIYAYGHSSEMVNNKLFLGLLDVDPFSGELVGEIAKNWAVSNDGLTYTFNLNGDIFWTDGTPVTAYDILFTYGALWDDQVESPYTSILENVSSVSVVDAYTLQITFDINECSSLQDFTIGILPSHMYASDFSDLQTNPLNRTPTVTNGPFKFDEWISSDYISLVRNENYYLGGPHIDRWVLRIFEDTSSELSAFLSGDVDVTTVAPQDVAAIEREIANGQPFAIKDLFTDGYNYLGLNLGDPNNPEIGWIDINDNGEFDEGEPPNLEQSRHPILQDKLVRQAIAHAIDYTSIIEQAAYGQGAPMASNVLPAITWAYNTEIEPYSLDIAKAATLLEEAGWVYNTEGFRMKDGERLSLHIMVNEGNAAREIMASIIKDNLDALGFDITVDILDWGTVVGNLLGQQFDMVIIGWIELGVDPDDSFFWSYGNDDPGFGFNLYSYYNEEVEQKLSQAKSIPGCPIQGRSSLYQDIQSQIHEDVPYVLLYNTLTNVLWNTRVQGINPGPWSTDYNVHEWYIKP
jgi:peptide/nickel transport system substrate-binding protein